MQQLLNKFLEEDQPFIIYTDNYVSGACYLEEIKDNWLVDWELGEDCHERIVFYNIEEIVKIQFCYNGDLEIVEDNEFEPQGKYIF